MKTITKKRISIDNDYLFFDGQNNELTFKNNKVKITLTEKQYALFSLLLKNKHDREYIIDFLWNSGDEVIKISNYY